MATDILHNESDTRAAMYDTVTDSAFGPVAFGTDEYSASEYLQLFLIWLPVDPRNLASGELEVYWEAWQASPIDLHKQH